MTKNKDVPLWVRLRDLADRMAEDEVRKITCTCCRKVSHLHAFCHSAYKFECIECGVEFDVLLRDNVLASLIGMSVGSLRSRIMKLGIEHIKWGSLMIIDTSNLAHGFCQ